MRSKADETLVIVETLICPLQISHARNNFNGSYDEGRIFQRFKVFSAHPAISQAHTLITFN